MKPVFPFLAVAVLLQSAASADDLPLVTQVDAQPVILHTKRLVEALDFLGEPLPAAERAELDKVFADAAGADAVAKIQQILDPHCLAGVNINPESRVKAAPGAAPRRLQQQGWRHFLVKVHNEAGVTAPLGIKSDQTKPLANSPKEKLEDRWLDAALYDGRPLEKNLSGLKLEYRIIQLSSRDAGKRSAVIEFNAGQGTQDLGFRADLTLTFDCAPAREVKIRVHDENGKPVTAGFEIRDNAGRVYPSMSRRLPPDFHFHPQVYRADGSTLLLPSGHFTVKCTRGPEYLAQETQFDLSEGDGSGPPSISFDLKRWIDPAKTGWWSGDHHIHAAGCAHFTKPTEGVHAQDMMLHCLGEDLKIGANLTWGPCFDYQKQFFTGKEDKVSQPPYLLRYDVEVSGFGSHQNGHLCLLRLQDQMYPGGDSSHHWPTLCLNTLRWAQKQGAVCGPAHSGWGLKMPADKLPSYEMAPFDGIGACEYIVDVTHEVPGPGDTIVPAVDFISTVDTPWPYELNVWYHTLNCGYRTRISGETDFPCIYGERVGLGRSYVKLDGPLTYDTWCEGVSQGRCYVSDGHSHLLDFKLGDRAVGTERSELRLAEPGTLKATVKAAALLPEKPRPEISSRSVDQQPYWHLERARQGDGRDVKVELVVNGQSVATQKLTADGAQQDLSFDVNLERSSWVAVRILPSSHTNPVFVVVGGKPIRASRRSADWCLRAVDQCWSQKERFIADAEKADGIRAWDHARQEYRRILAECEAE